MKEKIIILIVAYLVSIVMAYLVVRTTYINEKINKSLGIGSPDAYGIFAIFCPIVNTCIAIEMPIVLLINFISDKLSSINYDKFFRMSSKNTQTNNTKENM